jgi:hypothetical protein
MADYLSVVNDAGEQALDLMKRGQEAAISAVATVSDMASAFVPNLEGQLPYSDSIPAPKDVAATSFALAGKFLDAQRDYVLALYEAVSPVTERILASPKRKSSTKKSGAKRAA